MNKKWKLAARVAAFAFTAMMLIACDQLDKLVESTTSSGGGSDSSSGSNNDQPTEIVRLGAFNEFKCTSNWTNRDGGLGLKVGSGSGTCEARFHGESGVYQVELQAQTEREGQSPYRISINGNQVSSGKFPFSQGELNCNCYRQPWQVYCPDVVMNLDTGTHQINNGDIIGYYGEEEYLCGKHGAYSKWRGMLFKPVN
jgi:hypothetical protein